MKKFLLLLTVITSLTLVGLTFGTDGVQVKTATTQDGVPVRVYMIQDIENDTWYTLRPPLGTVGWGPQQEAFVFSVKKRAERAHTTLFGNRKTALRVFLLLPVEENQ